ncbi:hypothetical protein HDV00_003889 [Rhizophlyctis rosea]|nr:hypothetical protein HDV00_003889 [Rhizophlyctis rosea]
MSAFTGVAQYNPKNQNLLLSYRPESVGPYRQGNFVDLLHKHSSLVDEEIPISERHRFRRIPEDILDLDPRELNVRELFDTARPNGKPSFRKGEEVEVQWKFRQNGEWAWWRGIVEYCRGGGYGAPTVEGLVESDDSSGDDEEEAFDDELNPRGIKVVFPHYPPGSIWDSVVANSFGLPGLNPPNSGSLGLVGGVRRVRCVVHQALWKRNFVMVRFEGAVDVDAAAAEQQDNDDAESWVTDSDAGQGMANAEGSVAIEGNGQV